MKGRGWIRGASDPGAVVDLDIEASFGDYGRNDNPTLTVTSGNDCGMTIEFATPDAARVLAERLLELARKAEAKASHRGPEYRARLARDEALEEMRALTKRVESAMGIEGPVDGLHVMTSVFGQPDRRPSTDN